MHDMYDLVFEGGGAKGVAFVGALEAFDDAGLKPRRVVGTSAGAITATMVAAEFGPADLKRMAEETVVNPKTGKSEPRFATFLDIPEEFENRFIADSLTQRALDKVDVPGVPGFIDRVVDRTLINNLMKIDAFRQVFSFVERGGLYAGDKFRAWIREKLNDKQVRLGDARLKEFHDRTGKRTGRELSVVVCDTAGRKPLVLNHRTAPHCPVDWAVRMSMSIPFIWQEVIWKTDWGPYLGRDITGHTLVDGGALSNFPLEYVVSDGRHVQAVMGDTHPNGAGTLGLLIDEQHPVPNAGAGEKLTQPAEAQGLLGDPQRLKTVHRVMRLVGTIMEARDKQFIDGYAPHVCRLPAKGFGTTEFHMSPGRMRALIEAGRMAMTDHLNKRPAPVQPGTMPTQPSGGIRGQESGGSAVAERLETLIRQLDQERIQLQIMGRGLLVEERLRVEQIQIALPLLRRALEQLGTTTVPGS